MFGKTRKFLSVALLTVLLLTLLPTGSMAAQWDDDVTGTGAGIQGKGIPTVVNTDQKGDDNILGRPDTLSEFLWKKCITLPAAYGEGTLIMAVLQSGGSQMAVTNFTWMVITGGENVTAVKREDGSWVIFGIQPDEVVTIYAKDENGNNYAITMVGLHENSFYGGTNQESAQPASGTSYSPRIFGPDEIHLEQGYAEVTVPYTLTGSPAPTAAMDPANNTANATISGDGKLTIPVGLLASSTSYSANFTAANTEGTAAKTVKVYVYDKLVVTDHSSVSGSQWYWSPPYRDLPYDVRANHVSGGSGSYVYSLATTSSALPNGLTLDSRTGVISGTPAGGFYGSVIIDVHDEKTGVTVSGTFNIIIV